MADIVRANGAAEMQGGHAYLQIPKWNHEAFHPRFRVGLRDELGNLLGERLNRNGRIYSV